jgi:NADPH-dependent curcumin reductase CurA
MNKNLNRQWLLATRPKGMVRETDFEYSETAIPTPNEGEFLVRNLYVSFDPAMRGWMVDRPSYTPPVQIGDVMRAGAVAQVVESRHPDFKPGDFVYGTFGWQDYMATSGRDIMPVKKIPPGLSHTLPLGVLGINGVTAYFGLLDIGRPQAGEMVVVSGAAGATGSVAGQIAKIKDCHVIGIAGGPEKCRWLTSEVGFDAAIDYKSEHVKKRLIELCPSGINIFYDNVGGEILDAALALLAMKARVVLCGAISRYNEETPSPGPTNYLSLIIQRARMEGFIVTDYAPRFDEALKELTSWLKAGKIKFKEDIKEGFENIPKTFLRLFEGRNFGKQLLKIADPPL